MTDDQFVAVSFTDGHFQRWPLPLDQTPKRRWKSCDASSSAASGFATRVDQDVLAVLNRRRRSRESKRHRTPERRPPPRRGTRRSDHTRRRQDGLARRSTAVCGSRSRRTLGFVLDWVTLELFHLLRREDSIARNDQDKGSVRPSEQRGGTTPDEAEAREKGVLGGRSSDGKVPAELGGSDAPREMLERIRNSAAQSSERRLAPTNLRPRMVSTLAVETTPTRPPTVAKTDRKASSRPQGRSDRARPSRADSSG